MSRRACLYLVGFCALLTLAGCGGGWFMAQRDPWRHEAEVACLRSGQVKVGTAVAQMPAISGPGICGADFPLKVALLGDGAALGFADDLRPPAPIPQYSASRPAAAPGYGGYPPSYPAANAQQPYGSQAYPAAPGAPISLKPPGIDPEADEESPPPPSAPTYGRSGPILSQPMPPPAPYSPRPYSTRESPYDTPAAQPPDPYYTPPPRNYGTAAPYGARPAPGTEPLPPLGPAVPAMAGGTAAVTPAATLACPMVSALDQWVAGSVQPAALRWFGQPVVEIRQISAYSCRGMNGNPHAHISEHAFGNALDVNAFTLADGRTVTVKNGWRGPPEERGFLHDVHAAACQQFSTVLGPGSNVYHYDHLHLDLMRRSSGRSICNPAAVPGDVIASHMGYGRDVTGSLGARAARLTGSGRDTEQERASYERKLPRAEPGADGW